jgi:hypothetical protein
MEGGAPKMDQNAQFEWETSGKLQAKHTLKDPLEDPNHK